MTSKWGSRLIKVSAIFGLIGAVLGSHMAGAGSLAFKPVHAHILVVGWLSLFAWGIYYKVVRVTSPKLVALQAWTGIIGTTGLVVGLWMQYVQPFGNIKAIILPVYIGGGTILLLSFALFAVITFIGEKATTAK